MEMHSDAHTETREPPAPHAQQRKPERWEVNRSGSSLTFTLRQLLVQRVSGRFSSWGGTLFLDRRQPSLSSVRLWVDMGSIDTQSMERDIHLCSAEFFDVARYPRATYYSTGVKVEDGKVVVDGRLCLHGVLREVRLSITPMTMPESATIGQRETFAVTAKVNRQDFGVRWNDRKIDFVETAVGDQVHIDAQVEVVRALDDESQDLL